MAKNKIEIPKLILDHLLQYGNTSILGLGTLFYNNHSAYLSDDKSQIFPPSNTLLFKDDVDDTDQFAYYVANRLGIKPVKALEKVDNYAQHLVNNILNYGTVEIPSIGSFTKTEGKDIVFAQEHGEVNSAFFGLLPVKLKPIQFFKDGDMADAPMAVSTASVPNRTAAASTIAATTNSSTTPTYNYNDDDESSWIKPLLWIFGVVLLSALLYKGCQSYNNGQAGLPPVSQIDSTDVDGDHSGLVTDDGKTIGSDTSTHGKVTIVDNTTKTRKPTECIIILGAYESARNAMKMSSRITQLGYTPYEEYFDTMDVTRVGFKFDCSEKDLQDFMHEVREDIAQDAWYLVPRITVE